jgi:hypothetical protein
MLCFKCSVIICHAEALNNLSQTQSVALIVLLVDLHSQTPPRLGEVKSHTCWSLQGESEGGPGD